MKRNIRRAIERIPQWVIESEKQLYELGSPGYEHYCDIDRYTNALCEYHGVLRECGHFICDAHFNPLECPACLGIRKKALRIISRAYLLMLNRNNFRKSVAQIKIARWWKKQLFIKRINELRCLKAKKSQLEQKKKDQELRNAWLDRLEKEMKK